MASLPGHLGSGAPSLCQVSPMTWELSEVDLGGIIWCSEELRPQITVLFTGLGSLAASYLNPVKSFVPQMPKLLKSLFPIRDEKKGRQPSPLAQQVRMQQLWKTAEEERGAILSSAPVA